MRAQHTTSERETRREAPDKNQETHNETNT